MFPKIVIRRPHKAKTILPAPISAKMKEHTEPELLSGMVNDIKASAPEERLFKAFDKQGLQAEFRRALVAPRNMPGFKEVDAVLQAKGIVYAIEVDTAFTHRDKQRADVLHDAIVLKELAKEGMQVFPKVIHLDGDSDLVDQTWADRTVKRLFG